MRAVVHFAAAPALAFAFGRWLRDPSPGGPLLGLLGAAILFAVAAKQLYGPGGLGRAREPVAIAAAEPPADRLDLNRATAAELERVPGIGPVGAGRIVEEREGGGPYRSVGDLVRVPGFGPSRVRGLGGAGQGLTNGGRVGFRSCFVDLDRCPPAEVDVTRAVLVFRRAASHRAPRDRRNVTSRGGPPPLPTQRARYRPRPQCR